MWISKHLEHTPGWYGAEIWPSSRPCFFVRSVARTLCVCRVENRLDAWFFVRYGRQASRRFSMRQPEGRATGQLQIILRTKAWIPTLYLQCPSKIFATL